MMDFIKRYAQKGGRTVNIGSAFAIGISDVRFFTPPPSRSTRPHGNGEGGIIRNLLRAINREVAHAATGPVTTWMPRMTNYPY